MYICNEYIPSNGKVLYVGRLFLYLNVNASADLMYCLDI